jgi:sugar phosphate isomerase/epimerase
MELCLYTDSVPELTFEEALDLAARTGCRSIEIATGGQSPAPHLSLGALLAEPNARRAFQEAFTSRGLRIAALNCSAWPLHPVRGEADARLIRDTIRLAGELGVDRIVTMSGCPGDGPGATTIDWLFYPWPADAMALLDRQWAAAIPFWQEIGAFALSNGVARIAFELHPLHLVYNVPTVLRMREAVGPVIGANMDPSHLFWQQMDPLAVIRALGPAIHHVHLKDTQVVAEQVALAGVLDQRPFERVAERAWVFRTVGRVHGAEFWSAFVRELRSAGYDDALSIENEDATQTRVEGVEEAAAFILPLLSGGG